MYQNIFSPYREKVDVNRSLQDIADFHFIFPYVMVTESHVNY